LSDLRPDRLDAQRSQLLIIDIQAKLLPHIADHAGVLAQAVRMIRAAQVLDLPVTISEQYPKGLGASVPEIAEAAGHLTPIEKETFSFCANPPGRDHILKLNRPQVLLIGIEAHVCVQQTALDLLAMQMRPVVLADAVSSRRTFDRDIAFDRMRAAGVVVTTVESAIYELLVRSGTDQFKRMLPIVK
jgi:nicotinamidase-related amidase